MAPNSLVSYTIRDVARIAGVSPGTVSRVLNDSHLVSEATRARVLEVVSRLNYKPNLLARRLSLGKTLTIAVIVPFFTRPSVIERLNGIVSTLAESQYDLVIHNVDTPAQRDYCFKEIPHRERVDGVLIISLSPRDEDIQTLTSADVPIVLIDANHIGLDGLNRVVVDDVAGGEMAVQYLVELGHRRIGFIGDFLSNPFNFTSSRDRFAGYRQALEMHNLPFNPEYFAEDQHDRYAAFLLAQKMLGLPKPPTAIFAASDTQAMGVLQAARELSRQVPEDLSVIGYDDIEVAEYLGLTTIRQLLFESGQRGVELLLATLENPTSPAVLEILPNELIIRSTTAPPKQ